MGLFIEINAPPGILRIFAYIILLLILILCIITLLTRVPTPYLYPIISEDYWNSPDAFIVRVCVSLVIFVNVLMFNVVPSVAGLIGIATKKPFLLNVPPIVFGFDVLRTWLAILILILSSDHHHLSESTVNLLMVLDSSSFLNQFYTINPKFPQIESQVLLICGIMVEQILIKYCAACLVINYCWKIQEGILSTSPEYKMVKRPGVTPATMNMNQ